MRLGVKVAAAALTGTVTCALAVVPTPTPASAGVPRPTHVQVTTCSGALLSHKAMTTTSVDACLAAVRQTYKPYWCTNGLEGYVLDLKGLDEVQGKVATTWALRAGVKPYTVNAKTSDAAVEKAMCGGSEEQSAVVEPIPTSMSSSWVQPPAETPGPEVAGLASGPPLATQSNMATGETVDGVQCQTAEQTVIHVHTHLTIYVNGQARVIPYGIGIPGFQAVNVRGGPFVESGACFYWLHTHSTDGIIHIESPGRREQFTLGQFFEEWGIPLTSTQVGPATGNVTAFITVPGYATGIYTGDPRNLPLGDHYQIQLEVGTPIVAPYKVPNWGGL